MGQVVVTIGGKTYRMACDAGQEDHLRALAERFDALMGQLRDSFDGVGDDRLTVMTGIMILDQLGDAEERLKTLEARPANGSAGREDGDADARVAEIASRVERLTERLRTLRH